MGLKLTKIETFVTVDFSLCLANLKYNKNNVTGITVEKYIFICIK